MDDALYCCDEVAGVLEPTVWVVDDAAVRVLLDKDLWDCRSRGSGIGVFLLGCFPLLQRGYQPSAVSGQSRESEFPPTGELNDLTRLKSDLTHPVRIVYNKFKVFEKPSNRTNLELKRRVLDNCKTCRFSLLIEPVWNRDNFPACKLPNFSCYLISYRKRKRR